MSELNELIANEIADFFAGFGGPGEPDIQNGEAQRLLTERVLSVLALRERAEPVQVPEQPPEHLLPKSTSVDGSYRRGGIIHGWELCRAAMLDAGALPAPVVPAVPDEITPEDVRWMLKQSDIDDGPQHRTDLAHYIGAKMWNACRAAMLGAAPGKEG
ncbi:hypothetical protein ACI09J_001786 [Cronobacter turicensis]